MYFNKINITVIQNKLKVIKLKNFKTILENIIMIMWAYFFKLPVLTWEAFMCVPSFLNRMFLS
jgi:hypothetical protein